MNANKILTNSTKETFDFAKKFIKQLRGKKIIGLVGELGAGKTIFTKGLAAGLGIKKNITSPTFVIMKLYKPQQPTTKNRLLCHVDAYRINKPGDLTAIGAQEYFDRPDAIVVVEWADKIKKILPKKTKFITLKNLGENKRLIIFK